MNETTCPGCAAKLAASPLYQCCRCFTVYCQNCSNTDNGKLCPKCRMGPRLILDTQKK